MKKWILCFLKALCVSAALTINYPANDDYVYVSDRIANAFGRQNVHGVLLLLIFFWFYVKMDSNILKKVKIRGVYVVSCVLSFFQMSGLFYLNWVDLWGDGVQWTKFTIGWGGFWLLHILVIKCVYYLLFEKEWKYKISDRIHMFLEQRLFFKSTIWLLVLWLPHLIIKFPAGFCADSRTQLEQAMGFKPLSNHHPIALTLVLRKFTALGSHLGSVQMGIFIFVILQTIVLAMILSYGILVLQKAGTKDWILILCLLFCALNPFITGYVGVVIKDVPYTFALMLFMILLFELAVDARLFFEKKYKVVLMILATTTACLARNNGLYVVIPTCIFVAIYLLKKYRSLMLVLLMVLTCAIPFAAEKGINKIYDPIPTNKVEALSLPVQQIGRVARDYPERITEEQKAVIDKVIPYDIMETQYNPYISDDLKSYVREDVTDEQWADFLKVWLQILQKNFPTCVGATYEQNITLFFTGYNNNSYYISGNEPGDIRMYGDVLQSPNWVQRAQGAYKQLLTYMHSLPLVSFVNNMAVYISGFVIASLLMFKRKQWDMIVCLIPQVFSILIIFLGPCIRWHVRYSFPIVWFFPFYFGMLMLSKNGKSGSVGEESGSMLNR